MNKHWWIFNWGRSEDPPIPGVCGGHKHWWFGITAFGREWELAGSKGM